MTSVAIDDTWGEILPSVARQRWVIRVMHLSGSVGYVTSFSRFGSKVWVSQNFCDAFILTTYQDVESALESVRSISAENGDTFMTFGVRAVRE